MFASLGNLSGYMDFTSLLTFGQTIIQGQVLSNIFMSVYTPLYLVYFGNAMAVAVCFVAAGYVAVHTVEAGVSFTKGLYYEYAKWSSWASSIATLELVILTLFLLWSLLIVILTLAGSGHVWDTLNARH